MRYSGIQPQYFPRLHYFARAIATDFFVLRDEVQFVNRHKYPDGKNGPSYQAHTPIAISNGSYLLTIPVTHQGVESIDQTLISYDQPWVLKHIKTLQSSYPHAINFAKIMPDIERILNNEHQFLSELNIQTFLWGVNILLNSPFSFSELSIENLNKALATKHPFRLKKIFRASEIKHQPNLTASEKILGLIKAVGADEDYTGGTAFQAYMEKDLFEKNSIKVTVQDWKCQSYSQVFTKRLGFTSNLSIIDLLMNTPLQQAIDIING